jgi:diguanylate cyclase (GGDEF)-like protein/PAS domain S-box-containing protein
MSASLDFKAMLTVLALIQVLRSGALLYVWYVHRGYPPAREWAIGSALSAIGILLLASRDMISINLSIFGGVFGILCGGLIFNFGILRTASTAVPWRSGIAALIATMVALAWFALVQPSQLARMAIFTAAIFALDTLTAVRILRTRRGPLFGMQRLVAVLLLVEAHAVLTRFVITLDTGRSVTTLESASYDAVFAFVIIAVTVMITLGLGFLTNLIDVTERRRLKVALGKTTRFLETILDAASDIAIIATDKNRTITVFNSGAESMLGYRADEVIGLMTPALFYDPQETEKLGAELSARFGRPIGGLNIFTDDAVVGRNRRWTYVHKDGSRVPVSVTVFAMRGEDNEVIGYLGVSHDITTQIADETALQREVAKSEGVSRVLETALGNMRQGLAMFDADMRLIVCNENYMAPYGLTREMAKPGTTFTEIIEMRIANGFYSAEGPDHYLHARLSAAKSMMQGDFEELSQLKDGRHIRLSGRCLATGGWVMTSEDVSELKRNEEQVAYFATHDVLTGLANRAQFKRRIEQAARELAEHGRLFHVLMLDLDRFKKVNDSFGHAAGDTLLIEVARRLKDAVRDCDVVARLGGDEFAIIQTSPRDADPEIQVADYRGGVIALAERILVAFNEPIDLGDRAVIAGTSIGIAFAPEDGTAADELLVKADFALYAAKAAGRGAYRVFNPDMMDAANEQDALEAEMRFGLAREEFVLHYQPIVDAQTREVVSFEALVRWNHPERGLLAPDRFIGLAEQTGLIVPLGEWVCQRACRDAVAWPDNITVAVNLSVVQLQKSEVLQAVLCALADSGLPPRRLEVEVTESVLLGDDSQAIDVLRRLQNIGVSVALDDFGTGYSSLTYLKRIRFNKLKIDRSFTRDLVDQTDSMAIVSAVCSLARGLDMVSTAEGVETEDQLIMLRLAGVTLAQGYLFGKPRPVDQLDLATGTGDASRMTMPRNVLAS